MTAMERAADSVSSFCCHDMTGSSCLSYGRSIGDDCQSHVDDCFANGVVSDDTRVPRRVPRVADRSLGQMAPMGMTADCLGLASTLMPDGSLPTFGSIVGADLSCCVGSTTRRAV